MGHSYFVELTATNMNDTPDSLNPEPSGEPASAATPSSTEVIYQGNNYDLAALVGMISAAFILFSCGTFGLGTYCFPVVAVGLGVVGLLKANEAVNPERTRLFSWLSIGTGGLILALIVVFIIFYFGLILFAIAAESGGF